MPGEKPSRHFEPAKTRMAPVELAIERAANCLRVPQCPLYGRDMRRGQNRIGVMKDQYVAGRVFRREIHLRATIRLRRSHVDGADGPRRFRRGRVRGGIGHNHFVQPFEPDECGKEMRETDVIVPGRDNDADPQPSPYRVAHSDFFRSRLRARSSARRSLAVRLPMPDLEILSSTGSIDS